ncbi:MAG: glutamate-ammonia-ligase adenylyltransferase, partial [Spirochaetota bacterium]
YGKPITFAGLEAEYALMGLGKMGGEALGYASDIELLFIYSDNGTTDGQEKISNAEFFERVFKNAVHMIETKREGIFSIDLRLRPYGKSSPIACSLENFCRYYGKDGHAHSYERLAMIRMRAIGGSRHFGARVERLRDEIIYSSESINLNELKELRQKQLKEKSASGKLNAKFSPGALVDLEYTVQILQCTYGKMHPALRTPRIHVALEELVKIGLLSETEARDLVETYHFFRRLINALRMLRGNARDLFLPEIESDEYSHLARRMGYIKEKNVSPPTILHLEFESRTAAIRTFVEKHLGRDTLPGPPVGNAADLVLSENLTHELKSKILFTGGLRNTGRAYANIRSLAGEGRRREIFSKLAILAWDILSKTPEPDMSLNNWERFVHSTPDPERHFIELLSQPKRLEILLSILAGSQFLADTLVKYPQFYEWASEPARIRTVRTKDAMEEDLKLLSAENPGHRNWLNALRRFRKREILRIGARDICFGAPLEEIVVELSNLAEAIITLDLERILSEPENRHAVDKFGFCILAFGKLGGRELNYSSDIDLLGIYDSPELYNLSYTEIESVKNTLTRIMERLRSDLSEHTEEGYAYRVDLRLRPYGRSGLLVQPVSELLRYYRESASRWEYQALLKLREIAGNLATGKKFLSEVEPYLRKTWDKREIGESIQRLRQSALQSQKERSISEIDIKSGPGGIRDIEFLLQGLQLINCFQYPEILTGSTMSGLKKIRQSRLLPEDVCKKLEVDYVFLRKIEHLLQIYDDRQVHSLPPGRHELESLSRRLDNKLDSDLFVKKITETLARVRHYYNTYLISNQSFTT